MNEAIKNFPKQLEFAPTIENTDKLGAYEHFVVLGMGGSHWAADIIAGWKPEISLRIHPDYGLPYIPDALMPRTLVIGSSYSGNTEEPIDGFEEAGRQGFSRAALAVGGRLLDLAREAGVPYIQFPDTGIQPRSALGFSMKAMLTLMGEKQAVHDLQALAAPLAGRMSDLETQGTRLAQDLKGHAPVIYASERNRAVAQNWKIRLNETGKVPAFWNTLPEMNHNEMTGFDIVPTTKTLSEHLAAVFLSDDEDHPKVRRRMAVTDALYRARGLKTATIPMTGARPFEKILSSVLIADWTAYHTARIYGTESEQVPMVEEFKKKIA